MSGAEWGERAAGAGGGARCAGEGTELHECLVEVAGGAWCDERAGELPELAAGGGSVRGFVDGEDAAEHARDVAVDGGHAAAEGDRRNRACGVVADAGECAQEEEIVGELADVAIDHDACGGVQAARAGVVAEAGPCGEYVAEWCVGEGAHGREARHPALPVGEYGLEAGLLGHHFADPDCVGIARATER